MTKTDVLAYYGGVTNTAKALGVSKTTVSLWGERLPWRYGLLIEKASKGALKYELQIPINNITGASKRNLNNEDQT